MPFPIDHHLIHDARKRATGADIHTAATLIAYYVNEVEIYNKNPNPRTLDYIQQFELGLRKFAYRKGSVSIDTLR